MPEASFAGEINVGVLMLTVVRETTLIEGSE
jgi:hypothetical protein